MRIVNEIDQAAKRLIAQGRMPSPDQLINGLLQGFAHALHPMKLAQGDVDFSMDAMYPGDMPESKRAKERNQWKENVERQALANNVRPAAPHNMFYISTSTRENSTFPEAQMGSKSPVFRGMLELLKQSPKVHKAEPGVGYWKDGAEESIAVNVNDPAHLVPLMSRLGLRLKQKGVIGFEETPGGSDVAHVLNVPRHIDPLTIHEGLMRHGVEFKTIVPSDQGNFVHVLDFGGSQTPSIEAYAKEIGANHAKMPGKIHFIGADTRDQAAEEYKKNLTRPQDLPTEWQKFDHPSINRLHRAGDYLIKEVAHGNPLAEVNGAQALHVLGINNIQAHDFNRGGRDYIATKWLHGSKPLSHLSPADIEKAKLTPQQLIKIAVAEWLINGFDRHGHNYLFHPEHGVVPIDLGYSFHHETADAGHYGDNPYMHHWMRPVSKEMRGGHESHVAAWNVAHMMVPPGELIHINPRDLAHMVQHKDTVAQLAHHVGSTYGPEEAEHTAEGVRARFDALHQVLHQSQGQPIETKTLDKALSHYGAEFTKRYAKTKGIDLIGHHDPSRDPRFPKISV